MKNLFFNGLVLGLLATAVSCKKSETFDAKEAADYYPLTVGKYITYRLDSTNYIGYTTTPTVRTYYVRDIIDAKVTDNLNRPAYRVARFIKDSLSQPNWRNNNTFLVVPLDKSFEYVENNLRYLRLQNPVKEGFNWLGNSYIESSGAYSNLSYLFRWEYQYEKIDQPFSVFSITVPNTITIKQADDTDGVPSDPNGYSGRDYSVEVFGKGIGLIYKEFLHWTYQPPQGNIPGYRSGYGVKLTMIDRN
jgi:hypothetical protein